MSEFSEVNDLAVIWVEVGRNLPQHLINNICLHRQLHPKLHQILISDAENFKGVERYCEVIRTSELTGFHESING